MEGKHVELLAAAIGLLLAAIGALGAVSPPRLIAFVSRFQSQRGLYGVAVVRIGIGAALLLAASNSRSPAFLGVLGVLALVSGIVTPFFGVHRFESLLGWWARQPGAFVRAWCALVVALGLAIVWAARI